MGVGCCPIEGEGAGIRKIAGGNANRGEDDDNMCHVGRTIQGAAVVCASAPGYRLCTAEEMAADKTKDEACGFDENLCPSDFCRSTFSDRMRRIS